MKGSWYTSKREHSEINVYLPFFERETIPAEENLLPLYMNPFSKGQLLKKFAPIWEQILSFKSSKGGKYILSSPEWSPLEV